MFSTSTNMELAEFIRSEMVDEIIFYNALGQETKISYHDFFIGLCKRKAIASHLELVSCITSIDEFYPTLYDCFVEDYGIIDFEVYPENLKKFSPLLFTLCLDFVNNNEIIVKRKYSKRGKDLAYLEKLLHSKIHYSKDESMETKSVYYKDFLGELIKSGDGVNSVLGVLMLEAEVLLTTTAKVEISEIVMLVFHKLLGGIVSTPAEINKKLRPSYVTDIQFMLSSVGIYTCVNHINKIGDLGVILPKLYTSNRGSLVPNPKDKHS